MAVGVAKRMQAGRTHHARSSGTHQIIVQNAARRQRGIAAIHSWTIRKPHQHRMTQVHQAFKRELSEVPINSVSGFLLHYACCDALAHIAWAAVAGRSPQAGLEKSLTLDNIARALQRIESPLSHDVIKRVFEGGKLAFPSASAKHLRDKIMHEVHPDAIDQVHLRGRELLADMDAVMTALAVKAADPAGIRVIT